MLFKSENTRRKVTLVAGLLFFLGMGQSVIASFMASNPNSQNSTQATETVASEQLDMESGYQIVLEREPNNQTALQGLVQARMAKEDWQGMIAPLDQLIALNPQEESAIALRKMVDEQLAQATETTETTSPLTPPESAPDSP
jgi:hypothetical protein